LYYLKDLKVCQEENETFLFLYWIARTLVHEPFTKMFIEAPRGDALTIILFSDPGAANTFVCPGVSATGYWLMFIGEVIKTTKCLVCALWKHSNGC